MLITEGGHTAALDVFGDAVAEADPLSIAESEFNVVWRSWIDRQLLSQGRNAVMLCDDVRRVVYFFLDGSLGDRKRHDIEQHLYGCHDCDGRVAIQRRLREFIRRRLAPVAAPDRLRVRLTQSIRIVVE